MLILLYFDIFDTLMNKIILATFDHLENPNTNDLTDIENYCVQF